MSDANAWNIPDQPRRGLDFNVVQIDLTWPESIGEPVNRGRVAIRGATWAHGLEVRFASVKHPNVTQSDPGAGELPVIVPLATALKRSGAKSTSGGMVHARLVARPDSWPGTLAARIVLYADWGWSRVAREQSVVFQAPVAMQLKVGRNVYPEIGRIAPDLATPAPNGGRGRFQFNATLV